MSAQQFEHDGFNSPREVEVARSAQHTPSVQSLAVVGEAAIHFEQARKARAAARTELSRRRRKWLEETGEFYDSSCTGEDDAAEMEAAIKARAASNVEYRRASSRLRAAIAKSIRSAT